MTERPATKRPITWAELILAVVILVTGGIGVQKLYGFVTDKISIEIRVRK